MDCSIKNHSTTNTAWVFTLVEAVVESTTGPLIFNFCIPLNIPEYFYLNHFLTDPIHSLQLVLKFQIWVPPQFALNNNTSFIIIIIIRLEIIYLDTNTIISQFLCRCQLPHSCIARLLGIRDLPFLFSFFILLYTDYFERFKSTANS